MRKCCCCLLALLTLGAARADYFVLINELDGRGHGPYLYGVGTAVLGGRWTLAIAGQAVRLRPAADAGPTYGPFTFTNRAELALGPDRYRLLFLSPAFEEGRRIGAQTRAMQDVVRSALKGEDPRAGMAAIQQAMTTNTLARNRHEVERALTQLGERVAKEDALLAEGKVKFEGVWVPRDVAEARQAEREAADKRAQGLVKVDGEWITMEESAARRRAQIAETMKKEAARLREAEARKCQRCNGTGAVYFEIRPVPSMSAHKMPDLRIERPGVPPPGLTVKTERAPCPACGGTGRRP
jgi:hypothetical protein